MMSKITVCDGTGLCLIQLDTNSCGKDGDMQCTHDCKPRLCPNYTVCKDIGPEWYFSCNRGRCTNCAIMFAADLDVEERSTAELCTRCTDNEVVFVKRKEDTKWVCVKCFREVYFKR